jgi:hypothetical protein
MLKPKCTTAIARKLTRDFSEDVRDRVRALANTEAFQQSRRERKKVEMRFAHMKRILRLDRLRLRGLSGVRDEVLLTATAQNLRWLAKLLYRTPRRPLWQRLAQRRRPTPKQGRTQQRTRGECISLSASCCHWQKCGAIPSPDQYGRGFGTHKRRREAGRLFKVAQSATAAHLRRLPFEDSTAQSALAVLAPGQARAQQQRRPLCS